MTSKTLDFTIFILYQLTEVWQMPSYKVYKLLKQSGALNDYLIPCYDVLHTLGSEYLVDDLTEYVRERGYAL